MNLLAKHNTSLPWLFGVACVCCSSSGTLAGDVDSSAGSGGQGGSADTVNDAGAPPAAAGKSGAAAGSSGASSAAGGSSDGGTDSADAGAPGSAGAGGDASPSACAGELEFERVIVDAGFTGENKALADVNGDGLLDIMVGSSELRWYEAPSWEAHLVDAAEHGFIGHMQAGDINRDGAVDLIIPDGDFIYWFENPMGSGGDVESPWLRHLVGDQGFWTHELELGDLNVDGKLDIVTNQNLNLWLQGKTPTEWVNVPLHGLADAEGLAVGHIDSDDRPDIAVQGHWIRTPADATKVEDYETFEIDETMHDSVVIKIADVNDDGAPDVAYAPKEDNISEIVWYSAEDPTETWVKHSVGPAGWAHEFVVVDFDGEGRKDFVFAEMSPSPTRRVGIFLQQPDGTFDLELIAETGSHNIVVGDIGGDCDLDIVGANWEAPPVEIFENQLCDGSKAACQ